jgi:glycosyltransferase involved in cell wall biosynthesis
LNKSKLKILFVSPESYYPENLNGVNKINFNLVKENTFYSIDYLTRNFTGDFPENTCISKHFSTNKNMTKKSKLRSLFSITPYNLETKKDVIDLVNRINEISSDYDIIHLSSISLINSIDLIQEQDKIFFSAIDCLSLIMHRKFKASSNIILKGLYYFEYLKCKYSEKRIYKKINQCHFVSNIDAQFAKDSLHLKNPIFIPNGIDTETFYDRLMNRNKKSLIFVGNFNYSPNQEAATFIIEELAPKLIELDTEIKVYLVGANPTKKMLTSKAKNVVVTGKVDSLTEYLQAASIFISPIFSGAGIKNKVLEAMASGLFTICSPLSLDGIELPINYSTVEQEKSSKEWMQKIELFVKDAKIDKDAIQAFHQKYSWSNIREEYFKLYKEKL